MPAADGFCDHPRCAWCQCVDSERSPRWRHNGTQIRPSNRDSRQQIHCTHTHKYKLQKNTSIDPQENHPSVLNKHVLLKISFPHKPESWDQINTNGLTGTKGFLPFFALFLGLYVSLPGFQCDLEMSCVSYGFRLFMCLGPRLEVFASTLWRWHRRRDEYTKCQPLNLISRDNCRPWQISLEYSLRKK